MPYETEEEKRRRIMEAMSASLGAPSSFVSTGNEVPPPIRSVEDARARYAESEQRLRGPMYAADSSEGKLGSMRPIVNMPPPSITASAPTPPMAESSPIALSAPQPRIGYSTAGLTGTDALVERRKAMQEADPESNVTSTGEIEPPQHRKGFMGHLKSLGEGALTGLAMADPDNPNAILGSAIGGGTLGAASPRGERKLVRRFEMNQLDNDIARGLKLEQEQAQLGGMKAVQHQHENAPTDQEKFDEATRIANEKLRIEEDRNRGLITDKEADRKQKELDRQSRKDIGAASNAARIRAAEITAGGKSDNTERKGVAAKEEFDRLVAEENEARARKDAAYDALKTIKENPAYPKEDLQQAQKAAEDADTFYRSFGEKKRDAQRRMTENTVSPGGTYSGRTMSQTNLAKYAKDKGLTLEAARAEVKGQGVRVQ